MASFLGRVGGNRMSMPASRLLPAKGSCWREGHSSVAPVCFASNRLALAGIARPGTFFYDGVRAYG
jgi:hypothetical protein